MKSYLNDLVFIQGRTISIKLFVNIHCRSFPQESITYLVLTAILSCYYSRIICACPSGLFWNYYWTLHQTRWLQKLFFLRHPSEDLCNMGLRHRILCSNIWSCLIWNSEQFCYLWTFLQREMTYWHMISKSICFSRPLMTILFQCPCFTWLCQVYAVFSPYYLSWW